jgi:hypothetical protein
MNFLSQLLFGSVETPVETSVETTVKTPVETSAKTPVKTSVDEEIESLVKGIENLDWFDVSDNVPYEKRTYEDFCKETRDNMLPQCLEYVLNEDGSIKPVFFEHKLHYAIYAISLVPLLNAIPPAHDEVWKNYVRSLKNLTIAPGNKKVMAMSLKNRFPNGSLTNVQLREVLSEVKHNAPVAKRMIKSPEYRKCLAFSMAMVYASVAIGKGDTSIEEIMLNSINVYLKFDIASDDFPVEQLVGSILNYYRVVQTGSVSISDSTVEHIVSNSVFEEIFNTAPVGNLNSTSVPMYTLETVAFVNHKSKPAKINRERSKRTRNPRSRGD